ncbi:MAG: PA0069 family radical SAM protein [Rhodospirillaceae bacterium]|nr:PA0069 family radical SAM protein [Rhodospirillaceae bacterium]
MVGAMARASDIDTELAQAPADDRLPERAIKGRGAVSNRAGRYEPALYERVDDGWTDPGADDDPAPPRTTLTRDTSRTIVARNNSPDVPFDRSINPYRGCEHGCVYCFARPTHAWLGLSAGLDFETKLLFKPEAAKLLEAELRRPGYRPAVMALGTNTDPYQPVERRLRITRSVLEVLAAFNHPVGIVTKSALVTRDIDILAPMAAKRLARVYISVTTLDPALAAKLEPRAPTPWRRLGAVKALAEAGVPVGVMVAPVIPALTDAEMERILEQAAAHGADSAGYVLLRLPLEIKELFEEWLEAHAPRKATRVLSLVRQTREGALYDPRWGKRQTGTGPYAALIARRFQLAIHRYGLDRRSWKFDLTVFRPPARSGDQLALF